MAAERPLTSDLPLAVAPDPKALPGDFTVPLASLLRRLRDRARHAAAGHLPAEAATSDKRVSVGGEKG